MAEDGKDIEYHGAEGESVHRLFLHAFLCFPDAYCAHLLFSLVRSCLSTIFQVVVRSVVSIITMSGQKNSTTPLRLFLIFLQ